MLFMARDAQQSGNYDETLSLYDACNRTLSILYGRGLPVLFYRVM